MQVNHVELLEWHLTPEGRCHGKVRMHGDGGETFVLDCDVPCAGNVGRRALNGALAQDAGRQLRQMPEYRKDPPQAAEHAMPQPRKRRRLQLSLG